MISSHYGKIPPDQATGVEGGFRWKRQDARTLVICAGYKKPPLSIAVELDEPWRSELVLAPHQALPAMAPVTTSPNALAENQVFGGDEEPTDVMGWTMRPTTRNFPMVYLLPQLPHPFNEIRFQIAVMSLPDVQTKEEFDKTPPSEIVAGLFYQVQFASPDQK